MNLTFRNSSGGSLSAARGFWLRGVAAAAIALAGLPAAPALAQAQYESSEIERSVRSAARSDREVRAFYEARGHRPLWLLGGMITPEAEQLLHILETADADNLDPRRYRPDRIADALSEAQGGSPRDIARAEVMLSSAFASYVRDVRSPRDVGMIYADAQLRPDVPSRREVLEEAARQESLATWLGTLGWMNPIYAQLRGALIAHRAYESAEPALQVPPGPILRPGATGVRVRLLRARLGMSPDGPYDSRVRDALREIQGAHGLPRDGIAGPLTIAVLNRGTREQQELLRLNLERARALPHDLGRRFVHVDAAAARLWVYEDGRVVDTMRVVVGKPEEPTPMMAALIRYATLNPYWNIPPDLVQNRIAPNVLESGERYLRDRRYEILSDWSENARVISPGEVDWRAVAAGQVELRVRQLPGADNAMGRMKFMFPNELGVYLHDTPNRELLREEARLFSAGCVRLEDAPRLGRWLFGRTLTARSRDPELRVDLDEPVPVYITYLTAAPEGGSIAMRPDVYNRDRAQLAALTAPRRSR